MEVVSLMCMIRSKCAWLVLALLVSASPVGGDPGEPPGKSQPARDTPRERQKPSDDTSLSLEAYIAAGMPAYDRTWTSADMAKAYKVLQKVAKDERRLPRYGSDRSGKLFDRIMSEDNLVFYEDRSVPVSRRFAVFGQYVDGLKGIGDMYPKDTTTEGGYIPDNVEIVGAAQRSARTGLKLAEEMVATFDKSHPRYAARMEGFDLIKRGAATMAAGALQGLEGLPSEQTHARKRLAGHIKATLPDILPRLPPGSRAEILVQLQELARKPSLSDVKIDLDEVVSQLRKAARKDNDPQP